MANTISALSYANTFGDWLVTTNLLSNEVDAIGYGNWHKPTGALYLDSTQLGLQLAGNTISYGYFQSLGSANSTYIQNNGIIGGQLYLQNTSLTLVSSGLISTPSISINGTTFNGAITPAQVSSVANTQIAGYITSSQIQPSPSFTGAPTSATPATGTSNTMIATTGFVTTAILNATGSLGTMSTQNSSAVNITGGTITGGTLDNVAIGQTTSANARIYSLGVGTLQSGTIGEIRAINNITAFYSSDKRLKENIINIVNPLDKIKKINGVTYDWTDKYIEDHGGEDGYFIRKHDVGLIAQEVEEILPEIVATTNDGYKAIKYDRIVALLVEAVKELKAEVDELKGK
jgi:hypothetical protein